MKSIRHVAQGAARYLVGEGEPFDQKNEMFKRAFWDPGMTALGRKFYKDPVPPKDKIGYRLQDQAFTNASWHLDSQYAQGVRGGRTGLYSWEWDGRFDFPRVPSGLSISVTDPIAVTREMKRAALFFGASLVGVCRLDRRWVYSSAYRITAEGGKPEPIEIPDSIQHVVALAVEMDYEGIRCSPAHPASASTGLGYSKMAFTAALLAQYIRGLGFQAIPCGNDTACSIPIAIDAGLGEMARNGLLVTPRFGPRVRLAKILTDLPLVPDKPIEFGVWDFCLVCERCAEKCPSRSIMHGRPSAEPHDISNRANVMTWHIHAERCLSFWADHGTDCSVCIRVCPFNKPAGRIHDWVRWGVNNLRAMDRLFLWGDDLMGYGKQQDPARFWRG